jgi:hypothetical protein
MLSQHKEEGEWQGWIECRDIIVATPESGWGRLRKP